MIWLYLLLREDRCRCSRTDGLRAKVPFNEKRVLSKLAFIIGIIALMIYLGHT
jgi:hypothetical protein